MSIFYDVTIATDHVLPHEAVIVGPIEAARDIIASEKSCGDYTILNRESIALRSAGYVDVVPGSRRLGRSTRLYPRDTAKS